MSWFFSIIRSIGASFPYSASLVQLHAEIDSAEMDRRIRRLEDPVSSLHPDIQKVSRAIYALVKDSGQENVSFSDQLIEEYSRPLSIIEKQGFIEGGHVIGKKWAGYTYICDPSYVLYMCKLSEPEEKMNSLFLLLEDSKPGDSFEGGVVQKTIDLPIPAIKAFFKVYESMGYGWCSKTIGSCYFGVTS